MAKQQTSAVPAEVKALRARIDQWRKTRVQGMAMPAELWATAAALARQHTVAVVARGLRVDFGALKARVIQAEAEEPRRMLPGPTADTGVDAGPGPGFVEVSVSQFVGRRPGAAVSEVELTGGDGDRLVFRLRDGAALDVVELAEAFWRRGA